MDQSEADRQWYVHIHSDLNRLHDFLARERLEGCEQVEAVMIIVENLTNQLPKP